MSAIELIDISKEYRQAFRRSAVLAVRDLSLSVEEGEVFGFIGANGAGKSTTIKIITGTLTPTRGTGRLFGKSVTEPAARIGVSYVPENPTLPELLTPLEVLQMAIRLHGVKVDDARAVSMRWLERFQLAHVANKLIRGFSKGMVQRTVLAHAMVIEPRLLILDEPLSGLDPIGRREVVEILGDYKRRGGAIFFTSHVLHDVERLADRFGLIHKGVMKTVETPADLVAESQTYTVRTIGDVEVLGMAPESGRRWYAEVESSALWGLLRALERAGHTLIEVKPALSLEGAFLKLVREDA